MKITGFVAAVHTPFDDRGDLALDVVKLQAKHLLNDGVTTVFVGGSTGESHSLTCDERLALTKRWADIPERNGLRLIVHVGSNSVRDASRIAEHAQAVGADAIAAVAPCYFKPPTTKALIETMKSIGAAAPSVPFYYYDIPAITGIQLPLMEFLQIARQAIPNLVGVKFTNSDLVVLQRVLANYGEQFDILFGSDELMLPALSLGIRGAVGSGYNFAAPIYHRIIADFDRNDLESARRWQCRGVQLVDTLCQFGYMPAAKAVMEMLGVPVGPPRLPFLGLDNAQKEKLKEALNAIGFFDWLQECLT